MSDGETTVRVVKDGLGRVWYEGRVDGREVRESGSDPYHIHTCRHRSRRKALRHARRYLALLLADNFEVISE